MSDGRLLFRASVTFLALGLLAWSFLQITSPDSADASTQSGNYAEEQGLSGYVLNTTTDATFLVVPAGAEHAYITVQGGDVCWGDNKNGTAPTTTNSGRWQAGSERAMTNAPLQLRRIRVLTCSGSPVMQIYFTRRWRPND